MTNFMWAALTISAASFTLVSTSARAMECESVGNLQEDDFQECSATPQGVQLDLLNIGLCTAKPDHNNREACGTVFTSPAGLPIEIKTGVSVPISDELELSEGQYTYGYLIFKNRIGLKLTQDFGSQNIAHFLSPENKARYCWTEAVDGVDFDAGEVSLTCGDTPIPGYAFERINVLPSPSGEFVVSYDGVPSSEPGKVFDIRILNATEDLASPPDSGADADRIMVIFQLDQPISIVEGVTTGLDVGFRSTNMAAIGLSACSSGGNCAEYGVVAGFGFYAREKSY